MFPFDDVIMIRIYSPTLVTISGLAWITYPYISRLNRCQWNNPDGYRTQTACDIHKINCISCRSTIGTAHMICQLLYILGQKRVPYSTRRFTKYPTDSEYRPISAQQNLNILRPRQNGRHFPDDIFKWIFLKENVWISINISLKFVPRVQITIFQHWFR